MRPAEKFTVHKAPDHGETWWLIERHSKPWRKGEKDTCPFPYPHGRGYSSHEWFGQWRFRTREDARTMVKALSLRLEEW